MHDEIYSDGIGEITVSGTIVRVDLMSMSPTERVNGSPKSVFRQRLIFSAEGFANSVGVMQKALQGLVEAGVVQRAPQAVEAITVPKASNISLARTEIPKPLNGSPNFK